MLIINLADSHRHNVDKAHSRIFFACLPIRPAVHSFFGGPLSLISALFQGCLLTHMSPKFPKFRGPVRSLVCSF